MLHVGIDEAGYGPNLGPLVMVAVVAEGDDRRPDLWNDLAETVARAKTRDGRVWVDDSKLIYAAGKGRDRLEAAAMAPLHATGAPVPATFGQWLAAVGAGSLDDVEILPWMTPGDDPEVPAASSRSLCEHHIALRPFSSARGWSIREVRAEVVGPSRFNAGIATGGNKAASHFAAFARLLVPIWDGLKPGESASVRGDKHGGRHFYLEPLSRILPDTWIDRGEEGPLLSRYTIRDRERNRTMHVSILPKADAHDGLVALASISAKALREAWMDLFNAHWTAQVPGLKPTAGYPVDARRFRAVIEPICEARGLQVSQWWRSA